MDVSCFKTLCSREEWNLFVDHVFSLASDIEKNGLKEPLKVWKVGDRYQISDGHHRIFALLVLKWTKIPCEVA